MAAARPARVRAAPARLSAEQEVAHVVAAAFAAEAPRRIAAQQEVEEVSSSLEEEGSVTAGPNIYTSPTIARADE